MTIKAKLENDTRQALKAGDSLVVSTLRYILAAVQNEQIAKQRELTDEETSQVLQRQAKTRRESIVAFKQGGREDLVAKESQELEILNKYLPQQLMEEELKKVVKSVVDELQAGPADFGKVMSKVMEKVKGKADGTLVSQLVKNCL